MVCGRASTLGHRVNGWGHRRGLGRLLATTMAVGLAGCRMPATSPRRPAAHGGSGFLKGQLHAHTNRSGDSATRPGDALRWYAEHGYDFVVVTDHNHVTAAPDGQDLGGLLAIRGAELTHNVPSCDPPPEPGLSCLLHVNALFLPASAEGALRLSQAGGSRLDIYRRAVRGTVAAGGVAQINHPNFHYAANAELLTALARAGASLLEVANEAVDSNNAGDDRHPSTEALWDAVLGAGATLWGTATDDAHHYYDAAAARAAGEPVFTGDRGFVMVRARRDVQDLRTAMLRGDFYASTGVLLARAEREASGALAVEVLAEAEGPHRITCIGAGSGVIAETAARAARCPPPPAGGYVRAVVTDQHGRRAWLQPSRAP